MQVLFRRWLVVVGIYFFEYILDTKKNLQIYFKEQNGAYDEHLITCTNVSDLF